MAGVMRRRLLVQSLAGAAVGLSLTVQIHGTHARATTGVPARYEGSWICQTSQPGTTSSRLTLIRRDPPPAP